MHSTTKMVTDFTFIKVLAGLAVLIFGTISTQLALGQPGFTSFGQSEFVGPPYTYLPARHITMAQGVRADGAVAAKDLLSVPILLPRLVDALQANDIATRNAASKAISNIVRKLDRNAYKRLQIHNWNNIETELERASVVLSLQPQHVNLQNEIDGLLRRVNSGEWNRLVRNRTRKTLQAKQLEFLADVSSSSSEGAPDKIHKFEKGFSQFSNSEKREILELFCQQAPPSLIEIIILSTNRHDDDFISALLWLAHEDDDATWEVLLASCCPQSKETRKLITETILRSSEKLLLKSELLYALSRSKEMEPEHARRLTRDFSRFVEHPCDDESFAYINAMGAFLISHKEALSSAQLDELKRQVIAQVLPRENETQWRSYLMGFVIDVFPSDSDVAYLLAKILSEPKSEKSIHFDALAAVAVNSFLCEYTKKALLYEAIHGEQAFRELALQGLTLVRNLEPAAIDSLIDIAFADDQSSRGVGSPSIEEPMRILAAKAIAAQGSRAVDRLRSLLQNRMGKRSNNQDLERLLRAIELCGEQDQELDNMLSQLVKDPFKSLNVRIAAWNARASTAMMTDRVLKEIHYYLNDWEYEPEARATAMCTLARICGACSIPKLSQYAHDDDRLIRISSRFAHHYAGESETAARLLIDEIETLVHDGSSSEDEKSQFEETIRTLIIEMRDSATDVLWTVLKSDAYTSEQKSVAFHALASNDKRSWKELLAFVKEGNLENQFSREIRAAWNFDEELVPALYAKILSSNPSTTFAQELWSIAEDTTLGLGAGDDGEFWGDNAIRVAISSHAQQTRAAPPVAAASPDGAAASKPLPADRLSDNAPSKSLVDSNTNIPKASAMPPDPITDGVIGNESQGMKEEIANSFTNKPTRLMALNQSLTEASVDSTAQHTRDRLVSVFYGTNRQLRALPNLGGTIRWGAFALSLACFLVCVVKFAKQRSMRFAIVALLGLMGLTSMARDSLDISYWFPNRAALFTGDYSSEIKYGVCEVSIPPIHAPGELESPSLLLKWEIVEDPEKHIVLKSTQPLERDDFFEKLQKTLDVKGKSLLVFIHGYNVSFDDAARRTAQMAYDLKFPGAPVFYSWPSYNNWYRYPDDKANIERSVDQIKEFLQQIAIDSKAESINVIAHSMGNVGLTQALAKMGVDRPIFNQVVLAAPDIDAKVFREDIAPRITNKANRFTLYTSKNDLALVASRFFNSSGRLGDSREGPTAVPGIDTIDATDIDTSLLGHSYYGSNASVLDDIASLLLGKPLSERSYLRAQSDVTPPYWTFDPSWRTAKGVETNSDQINRR